MTGKKLALMLAVIALTLPVAAQTRSQGGASLNLSGTIPRLLRVELDFSPTGSIIVAGSLGGGAGLVDLSGAGSVILGTARIFGNLAGNIVFSAVSENAGLLIASNPADPTTFPYWITLGGTRYDLDAGTASVIKPGATGDAGTAIQVGIGWIGLTGDPPATASSRYTDTIMFMLASN